MRRNNIVNPVATVIPIITKFDLSFFFGLGCDSDIIVNLPPFHLFVEVIHSVGGNPQQHVDKTMPFSSIIMPLYSEAKVSKNVHKNKS
jgi:hypothetical protein